MTDQKRTWYYGGCTLLVIGSIFFSAFLIRAVVQINFYNRGVLTSAKIDKIINRAGPEYYTSFRLDNDSVETAVIDSRENLGDVGDSIEVYYIKNSPSVGLASDVKGYRSIILLALIDLAFITLFIIILKKPQFILRFKGTLDQY